MNVTHSERMFVALGIQHAMGMRHIAICGLQGLYIICPYYLINGEIVEKKELLYIKYMIFIFSVTFVLDISHCKKN